MILCAGLSPAWQQIVELTRLQTGHVNRAAAVHWCASGKSLNVASALASLGVPCYSLCLSGGQQGRQLEQEFLSRNIRAEWVRTASPTRVCTTIVERGSRTTTELVENAQPILDPDWQRFLKVYSEATADARMVVLSGSLPPGVPRDCYAQLMARTNVPVVLDARGAEMMAALPNQPWVIKPNREELSQTVDSPIVSDAELVEAMRQLNARGAQWVVVTNGPEAVWATSAEQVLRCRPPAVVPVNAIGSGDCLAAGIAWGGHEGRDFSSALRIGVACAVENALQLLPARLERERVLTRAQEIEIETC
jgi:1-phosphofructokinase family hexose kinase